MLSCTYAFGHLNDIISISCDINTMHFSNFWHFCSPVKEKKKQWRIKRLTIAQWINLEEKNSNGSTSIYCIVRKTGPISSMLVSLRQAGKQAGRHAGRHAGRQSDKQVGMQAGWLAGCLVDWLASCLVGWLMDFEILQLLKVKLFRFLLYLMLLQCYYSINTALSLSFLNQVCTGHRLACAWFLKLMLCRLSVCVFVCVYMPKAINN